MKKIVLVLVIIVVALAAALSGCSSFNKDNGSDAEAVRYGFTRLEYSQLSEIDNWQFVADKDYKYAEIYCNFEEGGEFSRVYELNTIWSYEPERTIHRLYKGDAIRFSTHRYTTYSNNCEIYSIKIVSEYDAGSYYIYYVQSGEYEAS